ncbi:MAG: WXG100 family type VII secretion target [Aggregatilineales bacterium]
MADQIRLQYDDMNQISAKFANSADVIQELINRLVNQIGELQGGAWIGQGADAFYSEMEELVLPAVRKLSEALETSGTLTQQIVRTVQDAEEEAGSYFAQNI